LTLSVLLLLQVLLGVVSREQADVDVAVDGTNEAYCATPADGSDSSQQCLAAPTNVHELADDVPWYRQITECIDKDAKCQQWADRNECATLPERMLELCPAACNLCDNDEASTVNNCYGEAQRVEGTQATKTAARIRETEDYMMQQVFVEQKYKKIRGECKNRNQDCSFWAVIGECEANPKYMTIQCSPACFTCEQLDITVRCPFDQNEPGVWGPGDLNRMFERITTHESYDKYNVTVWSSPAERDAKTAAELPWVITLDDFLSPEECDRLIALGHERGYKRSEDVGKQLFDGTFEPYLNPSRTSTTAWCVDDCYEDPVAVAVQGRVEELTGIPIDNSEFLQLLRYEVTQRYKVHHDYIPFHRQRAQGVRILTVFLYLNDVEAGGGTHFPTLDLTVLPKQGRVLLWPSVLNERPDSKDSVTMHEALPVEAGIKYSANSWIHQRNFKVPFETDCQ
jgi:prolyl 4-hydroxylase